MKKLLVIAMLSSLGISGSILSAAEPAAKPTPAPATSAAATVTKDPKTPAVGEPAKPDVNAAAKPDVKVDTKPDVKADAKPDVKADAKADAANANAKPGDDEEKLPPPSAADKGPSPQRFTPSEQVRADFDVSFPVDI